MHAIATMVGLIREGRSPHGFVWANGGYATKHSFGVYSATPAPWRHASPQAEIDSMPSRALATGADAAGNATVEAYTVVHGRDGRPARAIAAVRTPDGARAWATSDDAALGGAMCSDEWVGRSVRVTEDGGLLA
jgi:acetyl-CoA C-acetyltransferase